MADTLPPKRGRAIAIFGTMSNVGKSTLATALCRIFSDEGLRVAPYKAQNISNESYVAKDGEVARAQVAQAEAARTEPSVHMNPVLLKPFSYGSGVQVVVQGRATVGKEATDWFRDNNARLCAAAQSSLQHLLGSYEVVVVEGAGSCCELNLLERDYVNFRTAQAAGAAVILVGNISHGGIFAQLLGTLALLPPPYRQMVAGLVVNQFSGSPEYFKEGVKMLEEKAGLPVLGVIPDHGPDITLDAEDTLSLPTHANAGLPNPATVRVAVVALPHMSNASDFYSLSQTEWVSLRLLSTPTILHQAYDLVVLPGSKSVLSDLRWLKTTAWAQVLHEYIAGGGHVLGVCGGYQMLGRRVDDPEATEGTAPDSESGLCLLDCSTTLTTSKVTKKVQCTWYGGTAPIYGYEIHTGVTSQNKNQFLQASGSGNDPPTDHGCVSSCGHIAGCYVHGLFDGGVWRREYLGGLRKDLALPQENADAGTLREEQYVKLANHVRAHLDMARVREILGV
eukprot:comp21984_c0_seq1/m.31772 comp21984_c0_seq1/g.31772  ORF comp21984_c0_seq1/g.31772 comp21984_c0_seq1/m.31772 type:complete len:507 (-) comp21984_c0_seq1:409-1929(-)